MNISRRYNQTAVLVLTVFALIIVLCTLASRESNAQTTLTAIPITNATTITINNGPGIQWGPRISGDYVSYNNTNASEVRYYSFTTNSDQAIPGVGSDPDIADSNIVFIRPGGFGNHLVWTFHIPTATVSQLAPNPNPMPTPTPFAPTPTPTPPPSYESASIGSLTVAWEDHSNTSFSNQSTQVVTTNLANPFPLPLSNDFFKQNRQPSVSPNGDVIVWRKCDFNLPYQCDVWQAVKGQGQFGGWTISQLTNTGDVYNDHVDTNGSVVVYTRWNAMAQVSELYWKAVTAGTEHQVPFSGYLHSPSISGNLIVFGKLEGQLGQSTVPSDIYVYDISTDKVYQVTDTPGAWESHPDIWVAADGQVRVVYDSDAGTFPNNDPNVYAQTFYLNKTYTNRNLFLQEAGQLSSVDFDQTPCGAPIDVAPPFPSANADNVYSALGLTFQVGAKIRQDTSLASSAPNTLFAVPLFGPTPNRSIFGSFASPVYAVGFNNVGSAATLRIYDSSSTLLASTSVPQGGFIGIISVAPISSFELEGDVNLTADDLLFSQIATPDCVPPVISVPADITTNAVDSSGAVVSYSVTATDNVDLNPAVSCTPASGSTFPVGTTTVNCTATDASGNSSTATFQVTVQSAMQQLQELTSLVNSFNLQQGIENSLDGKLQNVRDALNAARAGDLATACNRQEAFINEVRAQTDKKISSAQAEQLIAAAKQVKAALGCPGARSQ